MPAPADDPAVYQRIADAARVAMDARIALEAAQAAYDAARAAYLDAFAAMDAVYPSPRKPAEPLTGL